MNSLINESGDPAQQVAQLRQRVAELESALQEGKTRQREMEDRLGQTQQKYMEILESSTLGIALAESERKYHDLFNSIDEGFCIIEVLFDDNDHPLDYRFLEVNQAFERQTGLVQAAGRCMREMAPKHEQHWFDIYGRIALTGEPARFSNPTQALGFFYNVYAFRVGKPEQRRVAVLLNDITERKKAEEELLDYKNHLEEQVYEAAHELVEAFRLNNKILDRISDAFFALDQNWQFTYVNSEALRQWRMHDSSQVMGSVFWDVFPNYNKIAYEMFYRAVSEQIPLSFEVYSSNYSCRWYHVNAYPSPDGLTVYFLDITKRKQVEEELRQSEERFYAAFHMSPAMMAILGMGDNRFVEANQTYLATLEFSREELIGHTPGELGLVIDKNANSNMEKLKAQKALNEHESIIPTRTGKILTVLSNSKIINLNGKQCRLVVVQNISSKKEMEANMARLDRLNLIGQMAAGIGHEIRNPMTAVRGFLQMLGDKPEYSNDLVFFELMIEELDRANSIISEFLGLARDKMIDLQPGSLKRVVKSLYPMIRSDANLREIDIKLDLLSAPQVLIDRNEIRQLILNMCRNAMEAMSSHGTLIIGTRPEGDEVILYINDEGGGLPPQIIDKLGTPFVTTKDNGTGLGLAICYSIAARHHARIDFETGPEGTTFYVRFPVGNKLGVHQMENNGGGGNLTIPSPRPKARFTPL